MARIRETAAPSAARTFDVGIHDKLPLGQLIVIVLQNIFGMTGMFVFPGIFGRRPARVLCGLFGRKPART